MIRLGLAVVLAVAAVVVPIVDKLWRDRKAWEDEIERRRRG